MKRWLLLALLLLAGCATPTYTNWPMPGMEAEPSPTYSLVMGDRISFMLLLPEQVKVDVQLDEHGYGELPRVGKIRLLGMTPEEAGDAVERVYREKGILLAGFPHCDPRLIHVTGEVNRPDRYAFLAGMRLSHVITDCGGFTRFANSKKLELRHADGSVHYFNYAKILQSPDNDPRVRPKDIVHVPRKPFAS